MKQVREFAVLLTIMVLCAFAIADNPPVPSTSAVSHGTSLVANALFDSMERIKEECQTDTPTTMLIEPGTHEGKTIRKTICASQ